MLTITKFQTVSDVCQRPVGGIEEHVCIHSLAVLFTYL